MRSRLFKCLTERISLFLASFLHQPGVCRPGHQPSLVGYRLKLLRPRLGKDTLTGPLERLDIIQTLGDAQAHHVRFAAILVKVADLLAKLQCG